MTYKEKCHFAVKELEAAKIWASSYNPPFMRLLRWFGCEIPFPQYNSFFMNTFLSGIYFACAWGGVMYFLTWKSQNLYFYEMLSQSLLGGAVFGIAMACYYKYCFKKYKLTPWHDINRASPHD